MSQGTIPSRTQSGKEARTIVQKEAKVRVEGSEDTVCRRLVVFADKPCRRDVASFRRTA